MKLNLAIGGRLGLSALLVFGLWVAPALAEGSKKDKEDVPKPAASGKNTPPVFRLDQTPLKRPGSLPSSFAPVIKNAASSVVSVFSSRTVQEPEYRGNPFLEDLLRRFGPAPEDDEAEVEPQPRRGNRKRSHQEMGLGSGVIVTEDGYIVTNNHVIEGADEIKVETANGTRYIARLIGADTATDTAVLKIDAEKLPAITIGTSEGLEVGDVVLAIGNPFGIGQTVTMGIISGIGRMQLGIVDYEDFIQTDAAINMGNSGGALIDAQGRLIGINTAILSRTGGNVGVGFAIPINMVRGVTERLTEFGHVSRGLLGLVPQRITPELARQFELKDTTGALVSGFPPNTESPARAAGIKPGDVITEFNGKKVNDDRHLRLMVSQTAPGTDSTLKIIRDGKEKNIKLKLAELPNRDMASNDSSSPGKANDNESLEGVTVDDIDTRTRRQFKIPPTIEGAIVTDVDPDSTSYEAGLRPGDVIMEINKKPVSDAKEAVRLSEKPEGAETLLRIYSNGNARYLTVENGKPGEKKPERPNEKPRSGGSRR